MQSKMQVLSEMQSIGGNKLGCVQACLCAAGRTMPITVHTTQKKKADNQLFYLFKGNGTMHNGASGSTGLLHNPLSVGDRSGGSHAILDGIVQFTTRCGEFVLKLDKDTSRLRGIYTPNQKKKKKKKNNNNSV